MAFNREHLSGPIYLGGAALAPRIWVYTHTDVGTGTDYFANATEYGMEAGDIVLSRQVNSLTAPTTWVVAFFYVSAIDADGHGTVTAMSLA